MAPMGGVVSIGLLSTLPNLQIIQLYTSSFPKIGTFNALKRALKVAFANIHTHFILCYFPMKTSKNIFVLIGLLTILLSASSANAGKHLIFLDGYLGWHYSMPPYLATHHQEIEALPFSGFTVVGNVYTSYVMSADQNSNQVTYERVWDEVKSLQGLFTTKTDNFLVIHLDFPGDFWDDTVWQRTTSNFAAVTRAAKNLGFKGILFDDEAYATGQHTHANYMSNFRFPKRAEVRDNPGNYSEWERLESQSNRGDWVDYTCYINGVKEEESENCSYRNPAHSFKEHMEKVASRFKNIMEAMEAEFPAITLLVMHGPATAHPKTNIPGHYIKPNSIFETNEYKGAMFLGLKQGIHGEASLYDLGEFYRYHTDQQFQDAYQWRKYGIVSDEYNNDLDDSYRWLVPVADRSSWSNDVGIGFMVSDYGLTPYGDDYDMPNACHPNEVESRLNMALSHSDDYVIFYSDSSLSNCDENIRWLDVAVPVPTGWLNMMQDVYNSITTMPVISGVHTDNITEHETTVIWDVSELATGQVQYGETMQYGHFTTKETSFNYDHHEQVMHGLNPGTTYHYRVISENKLGNRATSDDQIFTTLGQHATMTQHGFWSIMMPLLLRHDQ